MLFAISNCLGTLLMRLLLDKEIIRGDILGTTLSTLVIGAIIGGLVTFVRRDKAKWERQQKENNNN